jgi:hypothetical protein
MVGRWAPVELDGAFVTASSRVVRAMRCGRVRADSVRRRESIESTENCRVV